MKTTLMAVVLAAPSLFAAAIVDQSVVPGPLGAWRVSAHSGGYGVTSAQVVTPGMTGQLTRVDLPIWNYSGEAGSYILEIWNVNGTSPVEPPATAVATASVSAATLGSIPSGVNAWASFDLTAANMYVTTNSPFALVLKASYSNTDIEGFWLAQTADVYSGGAGWVRGRNDTSATDYTEWTGDFTGEAGPGPWDFYFRTWVDTAATQETPEPATSALIAAALLGGGLVRFRPARANRHSNQD